MRSPVPLFAIIVLPLLVLVNLYPLQAETLQGQFDWSTTIQVLTIPDGYENLTRTGTATFTYDTIANMGRGMHCSYEHYLRVAGSPGAFLRGKATFFRM